MKLPADFQVFGGSSPFSILERIDVGETTELSALLEIWNIAFSILERIDVGETIRRTLRMNERLQLSVSSNGSTWVKRLARGSSAGAWRSFSILERIDVGETLRYSQTGGRGALIFQYPRTDRRG